MTEYFSGRRRVEKTQAAYAGDLDQLCQFAGKASTLSILTTSFVTRWFEDLQVKGYSPATQRRKVAVLRVFCSFWVRKDQLPESPFWRIKLKTRSVDQPPAVLGVRELRALLNHAQGECVAADKALRRTMPVTKKRRARLRSQAYRTKRNLVIVEVLRATGMRAGELAALDVKDFVPRHACFTILGAAGRKTRRAYVLGKTAPVAIKDYLISRREVKQRTEALLLNAAGSRLSTQGITNVIKTLCARAGVRLITSGTFRHTLETTLLKKGVDLRVVLQVLGKTSSSTGHKPGSPTGKHIVRELNKVQALM